MNGSSSPTAIVTATLATASIAALASIITAIVTSINVSRQLRAQGELNRETFAHQTEQGRLEDARALRDAKITRLRAHYVAVVEAGYTMNLIIVDQQILYTGQEQDERDARLAARWQSAAASLNKALVELELETDAQSVLDAIRKTHRAFHEYRAWRALDPKEIPRSTWEKIHAKRFEMEAGIHELIAAARAHLDSL